MKSPTRSQYRLELAFDLVNKYAFPDQLKEYVHQFEGNLNIANSLIDSWLHDYEEVDTAVILPPLHDVVPGALHNAVASACKVMSIYPSMKTWIGEIPEEACRMFNRLYYSVHESLMLSLPLFYKGKENEKIIKRYMQLVADSHGETWQCSIYIPPAFLQSLHSHRVA